MGGGTLAVALDAPDGNGTPSANTSNNPNRKPSGVTEAPDASTGVDNDIAHFAPPHSPNNLFYYVELLKCLWTWSPFESSSNHGLRVIVLHTVRTTSTLATTLTVTNKYFELMSGVPQMKPKKLLATQFWLKEHYSTIVKPNFEAQ
ncbi:hypothetical protein CONPUDRAFT_74633 [Coniophora puteana RWD-64-598 SS2]|uniref:Uncharacterized protein n=1 Tax=Coniophora puteana (strain RWD-64-598) TaxID=741705 RepID=A0A5M3MKP0_CONPW|nr:uncharacterized protein CONPUDRAFT_74633 [Coniophora puteana RWD-64-598 SS2]EIW79121.1 hypothetical protein CONPUDRAFT_74633 [Coniophora puteana RWD-64-598 SS2]